MEIHWKNNNWGYNGVYKCIIYVYIHNCIHTHTITVDQYYISIYPHDENLLGTKIGINMIHWY